MTPDSPEVTPDSPPPAAAPAPSPGHQVRQARERAGSTIEDLAAQIKLSRSTLDALERDDFDQLGQPVYIRGYYRKVAKVLPVPEAELIAAYEARVRPGTPLAPARIPLAGGVASGAVQGQLPQTMGIVVALGVLLGVMYWFAGGESRPRDEIQPAGQSVGTPVSEPAAAVLPAGEVVATEPAPPAETVEPTPVEPATTPEDVVPNQLALRFIDASWVRVEDSRNKTLLIGLVRAGEKQALRGEPPYTVFIGNARKVEARFNGQPFDFARHIQANDTARFTVP